MMSGTHINNDLYEKAVFQLNNLQSNAAVLAKLQTNRQEMYSTNVQETLKFLEYVNVSLDDIDQLNCIHMTGTKGKGSTCAFVESILQNLGFKTGFFSSPHLVQVRERIRINGRPLSKDAFAHYFFQVFDAIQEKNPEDNMPAYFKFLTLMAFKIFCEEKVDIAIIEVGIGGEHDSTNIIQKPIVCGMSTLDFDHVQLLGSTLADIAWQKAGIMKKGSLFITVEQPADVMEVLQKRSIEKECPFHVAPPIESYRWPNDILPNFGVSGVHQHLNVSLALQLVRFWLLRKDHKKILDYLNLANDVESSNAAAGGDKDRQYSFSVAPLIVKSLESCTWPGRSQVLQKENNLTFFLDSAHTPQSIKFCTRWFVEQSDQLKRKDDSNLLRILIFNCTGNRDPKILLEPLTNCNFDMALFCPITLKRSIDQSNDSASRSFSDVDEAKKCIKIQTVWNSFGEKSCCSFTCIEETLNYVKELVKNNPNSQIHILVTGSVHLVGGVLHFEKPDIFDANN